VKALGRSLTNYFSSDALLPSKYIAYATPARIQDSQEQYTDRSRDLSSSKQYFFPSYLVQT
jgi:hypothetical protein